MTLYFSPNMIMNLYPHRVCPFPVSTGSQLYSVVDLGSIPMTTVLEKAVKMQTFSVRFSFHFVPPTLLVWAHKDRARYHTGSASQWRSCRFPPRNRDCLLLVKYFRVEKDCREWGEFPYRNWHVQMCCSHRRRRFCPCSSLH